MLGKSLVTRTLTTKPQGTERGASLSAGILAQPKGGGGRVAPLGYLETLNLDLSHCFYSQRLLQPQAVASSDGPHSSLWVTAPGGQGAPSQVMVILCPLL